jgi:hypothetical protein
MGRVHVHDVLVATSWLWLAACLTEPEEDAGLDPHSPSAEQPPRSCATEDPSMLAADGLLVEPDLTEPGDPGETVTIDVYVHVLLSTGGAGDVPDDQIEAQVEVLDEAFTGTPFRFGLAGITRSFRTGWHRMTPGSTAEATAKRILHRGTRSDLNIYLANPTDGPLGWATFPARVAEDLTGDGVVLLNGTLPGGKAVPFSEGDTATHEVGHWLGLHHTFQGGCSKSNDLVGDTNAEAEPALGCPFGRDSCTGESQPGRDPVENYMDFADDACMVAFTAGQVARMQAQWQAYRSF